MTETIVSAKKGYDPGKAQPARLVNAHEQLFSIDSYRGETKSYLVNLKHSTCTCPHWQERLKGTGQDCKHLTDTRRQNRFLKLLATARSLSDADLARLLIERTQLGDFETSGALRVVRQERRQAAARKEHIHRIIEVDAPKPIMGRSVKVYGPTTDEEARRAIFA